MDPNKIKIRMRVKTAPGLNPTSGFLIAPEFLKQRRPNQLARIYGPVAGHGGDVWWLVHDGAGTYKNENGEDFIDKKFIAPYSFTEFMPYGVKIGDLMNYEENKEVKK